MPASNDHGGGHPDDQFVEVVIATTSGHFPESGSERVPIHQHVSVELEKAKKALEIVDTSTWLATVNKSRIDPSKSYLENGLSGSFEIDWGPDHGGGG